jgi:hypothetical protein
MSRTTYPTRKDIENRLAEAFPAPQTAVLVGVLDDIRMVEVQRATETRELKVGLRNLTEQVTLLAEAQRDLAEAQRHTDERVGELAEAQRHTDNRMAEMVEAQGHLDLRMADMAEAQQDMARAQAGTQATLKDLALMVGGLANDFGLQLEDFSAALLPPWLARYHDIEGLTLGRQHLTLASGEVTEVDLMGTGQRAGEALVVVGECRARLGGGEARRLADKLDRVAETMAGRQMLRLIVAMSIHPSAEDVARERDILLIPYSRINRDRG